MKFSDLKNAKGRVPPNHFSMETFPLFEKIPDTADNLTLSLSHYQPGGGVAFGTQPVEVIYYILSGQMTLETESGEIALSEGEAVHISAGDKKGVWNRTDRQAAMLVIGNIPNDSPVLSQGK